MIINREMLFHHIVLDDFSSSFVFFISICITMAANYRQDPENIYSKWP